MTQVLTAKGRATRARIVEGAAEVLRERGVAFTTLDDIRDRTGTSKSQLFHYFPDGKDELLLAVAQFEADRVLEDQQPYLGRLDSWEDWRRWRDVVVERYERQGDQCPLGALFLQVGRSRPGSRAIVAELMRQWQDQLADGMRALQARGLASPSLDVGQASAALLAGIQGGVTDHDVHRRLHPPAGRARHGHRPAPRACRLAAASPYRPVRPPARACRRPRRAAGGRRGGDRRGTATGYGFSWTWVCVPVSCSGCTPWARRVAVRVTAVGWAPLKATVKAVR